MRLFIGSAHIEKAAQTTDEVKSLSALEFRQLAEIRELLRRSGGAAGEEIHGASQRYDVAIVQELAVLHRSKEPGEPPIRRAFPGSIEFVKEDDRHCARDFAASVQMPLATRYEPSQFADYPLGLICIAGCLGGVSEDLAKAGRVGRLGEVDVCGGQVEFVQDLLDGERLSASWRSENGQREWATWIRPSDVLPNQIAHRIQLVPLILSKEELAKTVDPRDWRAWFPIFVADDCQRLTKLGLGTRIPRYGCGHGVRPWTGGAESEKVAIRRLEITPLGPTAGNFYPRAKRVSPSKVPRCYFPDTGQGRGTGGPVSLAGSVGFDSFAADRGLIQRHSRSDESLKCLFINLLAIMNIDGPAGVAFEAGVE